jgi:hypothetical protein
MLCGGGLDYHALTTSRVAHELLGPHVDVGRTVPPMIHWRELRPC